MKEYRKLVRDKIPEVIRANGQIPVTHIATDDEFVTALGDKLAEEVEEFRQSGRPEEIADILEVVDAICQSKGIDPVEIRRLKDNKKIERGGFLKKIILDRVE